MTRGYPQRSTDIVGLFDVPTILSTLPSMIRSLRCIANGSLIRLRAQRLNLGKRRKTDPPGVLFPLKGTGSLQEPSPRTCAPPPTGFFLATGWPPGFIWDFFIQAPTAPSGPHELDYRAARG
jgi:hypothetical protein